MAAKKLVVALKSGQMRVVVLDLFRRAEQNFKKHSKNLEIVYKKEQPTLKKVL